MCWCTPEIRTPFCGKPGCEWPPQVGYSVSIADHRVTIDAVSTYTERLSRVVSAAVEDVLAPHVDHVGVEQVHTQPRGIGVVVSCVECGTRCEIRAMIDGTLMRVIMKDLTV